MTHHLFGWWNGECDVVETSEAALMPGLCQRLSVPVFPVNRPGAIAPQMCCAVTLCFGHPRSNCAGLGSFISNGFLPRHKSTRDEILVSKPATSVLKILSALLFFCFLQHFFSVIWFAELIILKNKTETTNQGSSSERHLGKEDYKDRLSLLSQPVCNIKVFYKEFMSRY